MGLLILGIAFNVFATVFNGRNAIKINSRISAFACGSNFVCTVFLLIKLITEL